MAKNKFKDPKDIRDKLVHLAFSENEITKIDEYRKKTNMTRTEFIRQAIWDKTTRIDHPDLLMTKTINNGQISEFLQEIKTTNLEQKKMLKKLNILNEIQKTLDALQSVVKRPEIEKNEKLVVELLKTHKHLKPMKIIELTEGKLRNHDVYDVISNKYLFKLNMNGEVELKNE